MTKQTTMTLSFPITRYRFHIRLASPLSLPDYSGSMLRGCFGNALKRASCITRQSRCEGCPLQASCAYRVVFEPASESMMDGRYQQHPVPYVIEPPSWGANVLDTGTDLRFNMVLIGDARSHLSMIILAWQQVCYNGIGKYKTKGTLTDVDVETESGWQRVFHHQSPTIASHKAELTMPSLQAPAAVTLKLNSPMRIQEHGRALGAKDLSVRHLIRAIGRRYQLMRTLYWPDGSAENRGSVDLKTVDELPHYDQNLFWRDWARYSNRQQQKMSLGGVMGEITLTGNLRPIWPELWLGQWLHIGTKTSFGMGRYAVINKEVIS